jgi:hypothetical protein
MSVFSSFTLVFHMRVNKVHLRPGPTNTLFSAKFALGKKEVPNLPTPEAVTALTTISDDSRPFD